jgi:hypothetical protein
VSTRVSRSSSSRRGHTPRPTLSSPGSANSSAPLRLGAFLRWLTAGLLVGTIAELILLGHYESPAQIVPFALCTLGLVALWVVGRWRGRLALLFHRSTMAALAAGCVYGAYEHALGNLGFVLETQPNVGAARLVVEVLTGRDPLLAPGVLLVIAALALASAYAVSGATPRETSAEDPREDRGQRAPLGRDR